MFISEAVFECLLHGRRRIRENSKFLENEIMLTFDIIHVPGGRIKNICTFRNFLKPSGSLYICIEN